MKRSKMSNSEDFEEEMRERIDNLEEEVQDLKEQNFVS